MIRILNTHLDDFIPNWHNRLNHVQYHILVLITEGQLTYQLNQHILHASKGDLLFIPSGTWREARNDNAHLHQKYAILFLNSSELDLPLIHKAVPRLIQSRSFEYLKERFMLIHRHSLEKRAYFDTICNGILLEMLGSLSREIEMPLIPARKMNHANILEQYMIEHFRDAIPLHELAALIDRSPNYTLSLFKEVSGMTPLQYQHRLRINAAMEMLQNTRLTISAIADHLGYYDTSYFHKMFRKITGLAPSSYGKQSQDFT